MLDERILGTRIQRAVRGRHDRMTAGFVGGGGAWSLETLHAGGSSAFWIAEWDVWNQNAPDQRIWRTIYSAGLTTQTQVGTPPDVTAHAAELLESLTTILRFSEAERCDPFTEMFRKAIAALSDHDMHGYHRDLAPPGVLHFIFAALDASTQRKLTVTYSVIRKPIQENLCLLEVIANDLHDFGTKLSTSPLLLRAQKAGGVHMHSERVRRALQIVGEQDRFSADYIAQIRYDRSADDSFDPSCNKATHLFTEHRALLTDPLDINFIFSDEYSHHTQWHYLYSRLPYLLSYTRQIVEHICSEIRPTDPVYLADIERREMAGMLLWQRNIDSTYRYAELARFTEQTRVRLEKACVDAGFRAPRLKDLPRMYRTGAFPGESPIRVRMRNAGFAAAALVGSVERKLDRLLARRTSDV